MFLNDYAKDPKKTSAISGFGVTETDGMLRPGIEEQQLFFPAGILGFPASRRFRLEKFRPDDGSDSPFMTLRCLDHELSFVVIHPSSLGMDYPMPTHQAMLDTLSASSGDQLTPLLIVTVRDKIEDITVNLQGPLIINSASSLGVQHVLEQHPLRYPLVRQVNE